MSVVSAFLIPGSPLPYVQKDNPPWARLAAAMEAAGKALDSSNPDSIIIYSTQWIAVLDQLWQTRERVTGTHVDENWHEYGDLDFDMRIDRDLAVRAIEKTDEIGIRSKSVDYDSFPIDTGTIVAANFLNPENSRPLVITSNNVYHDWDKTRQLGALAASAAADLGRRVSIVAVGGLSGSVFRKTIDIADDSIATDEDDEWNRRILGLIEQGASDEIISLLPSYSAAARVDMGFKHFAFLLGAIGGAYESAKVHAYEPLYGSGGAVIEFNR